MRGMIGVLSVCLLTAGSALASDPAVEEPDALDGFVETGDRVSCVRMRSTGIEAIDENRLLFKVGARFYLNETSGSCERADSTFYRLEARLFSPRACKGDIFSVIDNRSGFFAGACSLGEFQELKRKPKEEPSS